MPVPESKTCSKCGETKPLDEYYVHKGCRGGVRPDCKVCYRASVKAARAANLEVARSRDRARYLNDPTRRAAQIATARAHYVANRALHLAQKKAYYKANRDAWGTYRATRRARLMSVPYEHYTRRQIYDRDGGHCKRCGLALPFEPNGFQIDHIVPISLGGPDTPANVQLLCGPCNRKKWNRLDGQLYFAA